MGAGGGRVGGLHGAGAMKGSVGNGVVGGRVTISVGAKVLFVPAFTAVANVAARMAKKDIKFILEQYYLIEGLKILYIMWFWTNGRCMFSKIMS